MKSFTSKVKLILKGIQQHRQKILLFLTLSNAIAGKGGSGPEKATSDQPDAK